MDFGQLPATVRNAFGVLFPGVTVREIDMETEDDGGVEYEFEFTTADGMEFEAKLDAEGNLIEKEQEDGSDSIDDEAISLDLVPEPVRAAFDAAFPGAAVEKVEVGMEDGELRYEFEFTAADGREREAEFGTDGTWLD